MNDAKCPFCGQYALYASIREQWAHVPLHDDGHDLHEGTRVESEILQIICHGCNREVEVAHYFGHDEDPCDCAQEVDV